MRTTRNFFGLIGALIPVLFCGGLLIYFNRIREAGDGLLDGALGPTMMGLAAVGLLFLVLFLWKLRRYLVPPAPPKATAYGMDAALEEAKSDFDADAAMARYLARRGSVPPAVRSSTPFAPSDGDAPRPPAGSFGRKGTFQ